MPNIKTIKPAGGGDYSSLAAWYTYVLTQSTADQWAECYAGGDLGAVSITSWPGTSSPSTYGKIYVPEGNQCDGMTPTTGAYITTVAASYNGTLGMQTTQADYFQIKGIAFNGINDSDYGIEAQNGNNQLVDSVIGAGLQGGLVFIGGNQNGTFSGGKVRNCICYGGSGGEDNAFDAFASGFGVSCTINIEFDNCVVYDRPSDSNGFVAETLASAGQTCISNLICKNCVSIVNDVTSFDFIESVDGFGGTEISNLTNYNCASGDGTADDFGGSGNIVSQVDTDVFVDPTNALTLGVILWAKSTGNLIQAGLNLYAADFVTDLVNHTRPSVGNWDIGAVEYGVPNIKTIGFFGGADYSTLASWAIAQENFCAPDQWAECYSGGDLGAANINQTIAESNPDYYLKIYAAPGHRSNGIDPTTGAYIQGISFDNMILQAIWYSHTVGISFLGSGDQTDTGFYGGGNAQTVDGLFGKSIGTVAGFNSGDNEFYDNNVAMNCLGIDSLYPFVINTNAVGADSSCLANFYNCTAITNGALLSNAFSPYCNALSPWIAVVSETNYNCAGFNSQAGDYAKLYQGGGGSESIGMINYNCASQDTTADDFGGSDNVVSKNPDECFIDLTHFDARPKSTNDGLLGLGQNLFSLYETDMVGNPRPATGTWTIGAWIWVSQT